jgi:HEAT repeat protein
MNTARIRVALGLGLAITLFALAWTLAHTTVSTVSEPRNKTLEKLVRDLRSEGPWYYVLVKRAKAQRLLPAKWRRDMINVELRLTLTRYHAAMELRQMGTNAWPAVPTLIATVVRGNTQMSIGAAQALAGMKAEESPEWPSHRNALRGEKAAARAFHYLVTGGSASGAPYDLTHRRFGLIGLAASGPAAAVACADCVDTLRFTQEHELRLWATVALGAMGPQKNETAPTLKKILLDADEWPDVRGAAAHALANLDPHGAGTRTLLQQMLADPRAAVQVGAARALWKTHASADQVLTVLRPLLSHRLASIRTAALEGISEMGTAARASRPEVERLLSDDSENVRHAAAAALQRLPAR